MTERLADRYVLETELARGAAGTVYRAVDTATGEKVAVKVLRHEAAAEPGVVSAFLDEAEVLAEIDHPGIVRPRDFVATDEVMALVMDLVEGVDLRRQIRERGPLRPAQAARIVSQLAAALAAIHAVGIVHGDVKPGNVLVPFAGGSVRLADFGVAHRSTAEYGPTHGTPEYVAPEIIDGAGSSGKADVYGIGLILYEMLSGRSPYRGGPVDVVLKRHRECAPAPFPNCPPQLWSLILACTQVDPELRPDAADLPSRVQLAMPSLETLPPLPVMPADLPTYQSRQVGTNRPEGTVPPVEMSYPEPAAATSVMQIAATTSSVEDSAARERRNRRVLIGAGVGAVVALATLGAYVLFGGNSGDGPGDPGQQPAAVTSENPEIPSPTTDPTDPETDSAPSQDPTLGPETDSTEDDTPTDPGDGNDNGEIPLVPGQEQLGSPLPQFP
ncbi:serine/threonine-protein kinase [Phytomonospora endophytica]|uniref:non-specific serine/threonine protein kinase n=1 Tax=Phytomonospora endophytica TaxID=714109 RepID=A0A841G150_9ACTN|nr:serine/threonine-protein kinase [Phytomonospora endophytica]MBB6039658.1 serine/threonine-protein kinase [Phytomonospora endophytica]GIG65623.1 serine/threonine-protein kinase PkaB [Phytomonospora endophytica]